MLKALATLTLTLASSFAFAAECPVQFDNEDYLGSVAQAITSAKTCYAAVEIAESCALGASGDSLTTSTAIEKCDAGFVQKLSKRETAHYNSLMSKCGKKYADMQGTMYISAAGFCRLSVSRLYYNLYTPAETGE